MLKPLERFTDSLFPAKLTAKSTVSGVIHYSWKEMAVDPVTGSLSESEPGRLGVASNGEARELNNADVDITGSPVVWLRFRGTPGGYPIYEFDSGGGGAAAMSGGVIVVQLASDDLGANAPYYDGEVVAYQTSGPSAGLWTHQSDVWIKGMTATAGIPGSYTQPVYTQRYQAALQGGTHTISGDTRPVALIADQHGPYYRGSIRPNDGTDPGDMLHGSYHVRDVLRVAQLKAVGSADGPGDPIDAAVFIGAVPDGLLYQYYYLASAFSAGWSRRITGSGERTRRLGYGFTYLNPAFGEEYYFAVSASYYDPDLDENFPAMAGYAVTDETEAEWLGKWGTLEDGSVVKGGIITAIGAGGYDFGTW